VLASGSPQRKALLATLIESFTIVVADCDETPPPGPLTDAVRVIARRKAVAVAARGAVGTLLAADTVIDLDGELLGKPRDAAHAASMLSRLCGRDHAVHTGVALLHRSSRDGRAADARTVGVDGVATSTVRFRGQSPESIAAYVATGEPFGKSGSYAIQGGAAAFLERLIGDVDNVVGLPLALVRRLAEELSVRLDRAVPVAAIGASGVPPV
jgi:septum formation protein